MKTRRCSPGEGQRRLSAARKFLEAAEIYADDADPDGRRVAVSNAVLAGIAASDAMCCARLGQHAVGDDHRAATELVRGIGPAGSSAARSLTALLGIKNKAQYMAAAIGKSEAKAAVRRARNLVDAAETVVFSST